MLRRLVTALAVLFLALVAVSMLVAARRPDGPCDKYGSTYVPHRITAQQAAPGPGLVGMGSTGTAADEGQIACVTREHKKMLDNPGYTPEEEENR